MRSTAKWIQFLLLLFLISGCANSSPKTTLEGNGQTQCTGDLCISKIEATLSSTSTDLVLRLYLTGSGNASIEQLWLDTPITIEVATIKSASVVVTLDPRRVTTTATCWLTKDENSGGEIAVCIISLEATARKLIDQENTLQITVHPYNVTAEIWLMRNYEDNTFKWWYLVLGAGLLIISGMLVYKAYMAGEKGLFFKHLFGVGLGIALFAQAFTPAQWRSLPTGLATVLKGFLSILVLGFILTQVGEDLSKLRRREDKWCGD